jgi:hypothetical protein
LDKVTFNRGPALFFVVTNEVDIAVKVISPDSTLISDRDVSHSRSLHISPRFTFWSICSNTVKSEDFTSSRNGPDVTSETARDLPEILSHVNLGLEPFGTLREFVGDTTSEVDLGIA